MSDHAKKRVHGDGEKSSVGTRVLRQRSGTQNKNEFRDFAISEHGAGVPPHLSLEFQLMHFLQNSVGHTNECSAKRLHSSKHRFLLRKNRKPNGGRGRLRKMTL